MIDNFDDLDIHWGHDVEVTRYVDENGITQNVAIECTECYEVLINYDRETKH
jgi:hypothetical protein